MTKTNRVSITFSGRTGWLKLNSATCGSKVWVCINSLLSLVWGVLFEFFSFVVSVSCVELICFSCFSRKHLPSQQLCGLSLFSQRFFTIYGLKIAYSMYGISNLNILNIRINKSVMENIWYFILKIESKHIDSGLPCLQYITNLMYNKFLDVKKTYTNWREWLQMKIIWLVLKTATGFWD